MLFLETVNILILKINLVLKFVGGTSVGLVNKFRLIERNEETAIPANGIGRLLFKRNEFVNEQIDFIVNNNIEYIYYRAPTGSGKSVVLQLFGETLASKQHSVYWIRNSGDLNILSDEDRILRH